MQFCVVCFQNVLTFLNNPLDWRNLNIQREWVLNVPLEIQELFLTLFVNSDSARRSDNVMTFLRSKLTKLFLLFDAGLNTFNRLYSGILQKINTEELIVNYHSISTVFDITSQF